MEALWLHLFLENKTSKDGGVWVSIRYFQTISRAGTQYVLYNFITYSETLL